MSAIFLIVSLLFISLFQPLNGEWNSFHIDYKDTSSELCWIGARYDTDKSSQRANVTDLRHCHPYTLFYNSVMRGAKDENLVIAELGILHGASILMWKDYFLNASIYGFDFDKNLLNSFKLNYDNERIELAEINVQDRKNILDTFLATGKQYDFIIDDTTHQMEDQLRIIKNVHSYLKPGGMLIIEDVFQEYNEKKYINRLKPILDNFQDFYFVSMDHKNRCSTGWNNDKLFVLVKAGANPIFKNKKKMTIITPTANPSKLAAIKESIDFDYVDEWIIVYEESPDVFTAENNPKIKEYFNVNRNRNFALNQVQNEDTYIIFLDEENLINKDLYKLLNIMDEEKIYTFSDGTYKDPVMLIDFKLCKTVLWMENSVDYFYESYLQNKDKWIHVDLVKVHP